jgi:hypothetical protein
MILRDIPLKPRTLGNRYWNNASFILKNDTTLIVQQAAATNPTFRPGAWWVFYDAHQSHRAQVMHDDLDEMEAQAVLDHYIQTIGIKP